MSKRANAPRVGRLARWQRRSSYGILGFCVFSGLVWFALLDGLGWPAPRLVFWWIVHGAFGLAALVVLGAVLPHHVVVTWRHRRNRAIGTAALATMVLAALTALLLLYGAEPWHAAAHWAHVGMGMVVVAVFPWHVLRGRRAGRQPAA